MKFLFFFVCMLSLSLTSLAKVVHYNLTATKETVNMSGKKKVDFAIMINGGIPAPLLEFTEGDEAEITLTNKVKDDEVSVHWHGLLLDSFMDGVPYVSTPPIRPGESFTYKFKLRQSGTFWYHSHTGVQEQKGIYGGIIIHPKDKKRDYDRDYVIVVSDWSDEDANRILANLRKDGDYYLYKKGTIRSWWGAIREKKLKNFLYNEWTRMGGMDYSDVGYDAFLMNGKRKGEIFEAHPGEKIRLRVIDAAASSYFYLALANLPMKVIAVDGMEVIPVETNEILIGMAETYDILFTVPDHKAYEFKATVQDGTGSVSTWIGMGEKVPAPKKETPDLYALMDHSSMGHGTASTMDMSNIDHSQMDMESETRQKIDQEETNQMNDMNGMKMNHSKMDYGSMGGMEMDHSNHNPTASASGNIIPVLNVDGLQSPVKTVFDPKFPRHDVKLELDGDMRRYVWYINGKAIHEDMNLYIKEGEIVRYTFVNKTMMHHPMHLHGHFFRVLNQYGDNSPMKHTVDVPPHTTRTIEFMANEPGDWMFHCHNLYHMKTGMGRVVRYSSFKRRPEMEKYQKLDPHLHDHWYNRGLLEASTNHAQFELFTQKTRDEIELRTELRKDFGWKGEGDLFYKRWLSRWAHLIAGGTMVEGEGAGVVGFGYILPLLFETHTIIDHQGRIRFNIEKRFQWTKYIFSDTEFTFRQRQPSEFEISLMYQKNWAFSVGLMFTEKSAGAGLQYQF
jgi:CopA family copper-resistance protein